MQKKIHPVDDIPGQGSGLKFLQWFDTVGWLHRDQGWFTERVQGL